MMKKAQAEREAANAVQVKHPLAEYLAGKLSCKLCHVAVTSAQLWPAHLLSAGHQQVFLMCSAVFCTAGSCGRPCLTVTPDSNEAPSQPPPPLAAVPSCPSPRPESRGAQAKARHWSVEHCHTNNATSSHGPDRRAVRCAGSVLRLCCCSSRCSLGRVSRYSLFALHFNCNILPV